MRRVDRDTVTSALSWYKIWPLNGFQSHPRKTKTSQEAQSLHKFLEPTWKPTVNYTDNSPEFGKACKDLSRNHCPSTPHCSETIGIAQRAVRSIKERTSAVWMKNGGRMPWSPTAICQT